MAYYALETAYTPQGWEALLKNPHNRLEAVRPVVQRLGGKIINGWLQFGEYDLLIICEMPDNISASALAMSIGGGGAAKAIKTTPLMTFEDGLKALGKARESEYAPPESDFAYFGA